MKKEVLGILTFIFLCVCVLPVFAQGIPVSETSSMNSIMSNIQTIATEGVIFTLIMYIYFSLTIMKTSEKLNISKNWKGLAWLPPVIPYLMSQMAKKKWWPAVIFIVAPFVISLISSLVSFSSLQSGFSTTGNLGIGISMFPLILQGISLLSMLVLIVLMIIWTWRICELRQRPGWWAIVTPVVFVLGAVFAVLEISIITIITIAAAITWQFVMWGILGWSQKGVESRNYKEEKSNSKEKNSDEKENKAIEKLTEFIRQGKSRGHSTTKLKEMILKKGWSEEQFEKALEYSKKMQ